MVAMISLNNKSEEDMASTNIYAVILAGGIGTRMGNVEKPKQFMEIGGKPIIVHTIEKFMIHNEFQKVIVLSPRQWVNHTKDIIKKYIINSEKIVVIEGGKTRNDTVMNAIEFIEREFNLDDDTVIVTHDSVRPFVTHRIVKENIREAKKVGACDTVVPATDTIVESLDGKLISSIPNRDYMYQGQTPQSFKAKKLKELYFAISLEEKEILTDACKIFQVKGEQVSLVQGEVYNIKITYPYDMKVAQSLIGEENV